MHVPTVESTTTATRRRDRHHRERRPEGRRGQHSTRQTTSPRPRSSPYKRAALAIEKSDPGCHLDWSLLAGIGRVESNHGRYGGSQVYADGSTSPHIVGLALNGAGNVASISDTDGGRLDGDTTWDRAVGPMQFIPSTWAVVGHRR